MQLSRRVATPTKLHLLKGIVAKHLHLPATRLQLEPMNLIVPALKTKSVAANAPVNESFMAVKP
ncbi:hypothetical protein IGI04_037874 [Brassica rapa subsp. trilocularis]|uniref:Uncharacterized protein n=1 Tax=Brassica rapa subsp. trilocularis TaxID=1813537 RepID=A0ABQ7LIM9_BRACM|nr:hypothetical protein IGI04_037874 [Brassica rapa subsp. trilocularis]